MINHSHNEGINININNDISRLVILIYNPSVDAVIKATLFFNFSDTLKNINY